MAGYWSEYSYVGRMPDGKWRRFVNRKEYEEAYNAFNSDNDED